ncbi:I78 family peptidase inhibitor [Lentibacter sp. XHP0401]|jgi:Peptidase inhibitor I78 family|uniref:I78 family peptidase inhibitor n=1 Tax=Lentibacter sp. XHP0401 TaxID=2984334 RepID=UPI0021E876DE|nr:I78 family peptidase inhibitor [Lentibacter sp. XHP0401]MCV2893630.1 I78 family peptidase inhibitor [Lentibacter sp. XHP0401]
MKFTRFILAAVSLATMAACQTSLPSDQIPQEAKLPTTSKTDPCGANDLAFMTGMRVGEIKFDTLERPVRIVGPKSVVTLDHRPDRLNVDIDSSERITGFHCG